ncbi:MAG TPA: hypothetical protein VFI82_06970 [Terriglobales bacterium]|nr:hypothetical protein [Terriglobales bacterium]
MYRTLLGLVFLSALIGCGGTTSPRVPSGTAPIPTAAGPSGSGAPAAPVSPSIVQVAAGQNAAGVNISVAAPNGTAPIVQDLGVAAMTGTASAFNTGDVIHRGETARIVVFGPGLNSNMQVSIVGPNDIQISNVAAINASDGTPGVSFTAAVASKAAVGARTVVLQTPSGNMTMFAGGLEVVP